MKPFLDVAARYVRYDPFFSLVKTLPDPPQEYTRVIRELTQVAVQIGKLAQHAPDQAEALGRAISSALGITRGVLDELGKADSRMKISPEQAQEVL